MPAFAFSECAVECAAVDQQVLPGDVTGMGRAKECACRTEFVRVAEAPGWNRRHSVSGNLADAFSFLFGSLAQRATQRSVSKAPGSMLLMVTFLSATVRATPARNAVKPARALDDRSRPAKGIFTELM